MRRRDFISLVGAAVARPLAARAQQSDQLRRIGVLLMGDNPTGRAYFAAFLHEFELAGWSEGHFPAGVSS
jgi:putative tryptophan/tyrosine transport system substrate-binding protein